MNVLLISKTSQPIALVVGNPAAVHNLDVADGAVASSRHVLDLGNGVIARQNTAKHHMLVVEPRSGSCSDKELRAIGVLTLVGHG